MSTHKIYGRHAVLEALKADAGRVQKVILALGIHGPILDEIKHTAKTNGLQVEEVERRRFEKMVGPAVHQGVMALVKSREYTELEDLLVPAQPGSAPTLLVLTDEIEDPRNLGAIARSAEGAGANGLIITARRSAEITPVTEKASGGAMEHLPLVRVNNLVQTMTTIKAAGIWIAGLDAEGGQDFWTADFNRPLAVVIGGEGQGLRRLTKEHCDFLVRIPMFGKISSLNASVATGIVLYETLRQRRSTGPASRK